MTIRVPEVTINIVPSYQKQINQDQKVLFVGQKTAAGSATSGTLYPDIGNANEQTSLFGAASMLDLGIRAFRKINKLSRVDAIPLADFPAVVATGSITFVGTASAGGSIVVEINGIAHQYTLTINISDTAIMIGADLASQINLDATCDVTAINTNGVVALTAKVAGVAGNSITLSETGSVAGITYSDVAMAGGLDAAVAATGTIAFSGTASAAGTLIVDIGSSINNQYTLTISNTQTADSIGAALTALITADTLSPVTAINTTGSVALTAKNAGVEGNFIGLRTTGSVAGITITVTGMASGATNPTLASTLFDVVGNNRYQTIIWAESYTTTHLKTFLDDRFNIDNNILDGVAIICVTDTFANIKSLVTALNDKILCYIGDKKVTDTYYKGSRIFEIDYVKASEFAAIRSLRLTDGSDISRYIITSLGLKDNVGGMSIASLPYFNTSFYNLPLVDLQYDFSDDEVSQLKTAGASVLGNNIALNNLIAGEVVTTYKNDPAGNPDSTFKYLEYIDTASNIREYFYNNARTRFAQCRLTAGDVQPNRNMANAEIISAYFDELYQDLATLYVLTQIGKDPTTGVEYLTFFKQNKTVTLDLELGKATVTMIVPIVTQLRTILVTMQIGFSTVS